MDNLVNRPKGKGRRPKPKHEFKAPVTFPTALGDKDYFELEKVVSRGSYDPYEGDDDNFRSEL